MSTHTMPTPRGRSNYLRAADAAAYLGISTGTAANWRCAGIGPAWHKVGGHRVMYDLAELDRFVAAGRVQPGAA